jgi:hypothetical protein
MERIFLVDMTTLGIKQITLPGETTGNYTLMRLFNDLAIVKYSRCDQPTRIFACRFKQTLQSLELMAGHPNLQIDLLEENRC